MIISIRTGATDMVLRREDHESLADGIPQPDHFHGLAPWYGQRGSRLGHHPFIT